MSGLARSRPVFVAVPALLLFCALAVGSLVGDSPTMDEQNHLARGLALLKTGDARLSVEHPPLVNVLSALPVLTVRGLQLPTDHPSWEQPQGWYAFADQLLWARNRQEVTTMIFLARIPIVYLTIALAMIGFVLAREMWGKASAIAALLFLLFDPNILAHGRYTTTDLGGTTFLMLAALLLWRMWSTSDRSWTKVLAAGLGLGLAQASKLSNLAFIPIFLLLAMLPLYGQPFSWRSAWRRVAQLGLAALIAILVVWATYGFQWGAYSFENGGLDRLNDLSGPLPTYFQGIEQVVLLSSGGRPTFLMGRFSTEGFLAYFPVAFLVKTPLPTLGLFLLAAVLLVARREARRRALFLLLPAVIYFLISMQSGLNIGYRHLMPILPFIYVLSSGLVSGPLARRANGFFHQRALPVLVASGVAMLVIIDLWIYPHYLSYFNLIAGGPANGYNVLVDSNVDWGQDLIRLKDWMTEHDVDRVKLAWFGTADPDYYGISYDPLPGLPRHFDLWWNVPFDTDRPEPGVYAISVSNLWELPLEDKHVFRWFREGEPDDMIGYSIHIYRVAADG